MSKRFTFMGSDVAEVGQQFLAYALTLEKDKKYYFDVKRYYAPRSLDANGYAWVLIRELAQKIGRDPELVYKDHVLHCGGNYVVNPILNDAVERWRQIWTGKGLGWQAQVIGPCRNTAGYTNVASFYGSSVFTTLEMSNLLDNLIFSCKEQGIETDTPEQIAKRIDAWPY